MRRAKDKNDPYRLMSFGRRVYKSYDPRAKVLRQRCYEVLEALGQRDDPLRELAMPLGWISANCPRPPDADRAIFFDDPWPALKRPSRPIRSARSWSLCSSI